MSSIIVKTSPCKAAEAWKLHAAEHSMKEHPVIWCLYSLYSGKPGGSTFLDYKENVAERQLSGAFKQFQSRKILLTSETIYIWLRCLIDVFQNWDNFSIPLYQNIKSKCSQGKSGERLDKRKWGYLHLLSQFRLLFRQLLIKEEGVAFLEGFVSEVPRQTIEARVHGVSDKNTFRIKNYCQSTVTYALVKSFPYRFSFTCK